MPVRGPVALLGLCVIAGLVPGPLLAAAHGQVPEQPNIVVILADDLSYRDLGCYGQQHFTTPNLDRLATGGMRFTEAYSGAPECAPARGSLLTGMHLGHCRIRANRSARGQDHLVDADVTVAEVLKQAGYTTGFIGKWGVGLPGTEGAPERQGFDLSFGYYDQTRAHGFFPHFLLRNGQREWLPENHGFNMERVYEYNGRAVDQLDDVQNTYDADGRLVPDGVGDPARARYSEDLFQQEAQRFIRANHQRPFFLYYATQLPHGPCITPELGAYRDQPWSLKHREWAAMVGHLDRGVGRMVDLLEELEILENTVIFFASDNGYSQWGYFGRPAHQDDPLFQNKGPWSKGKFTCTHEGGLRVPFFAYWKGTVQAGQSDHVCALYDLLATTADLAGAEAPETDGLSLVPTLRGRSEDQQEHAYLYWEKKHTQSARVGHWWAFREHPSRPIALFDISEDLQCERDLAAVQPEVVARVAGIFSAARVDSEWYLNPGDSEDSVAARQRSAREAGSMQQGVRANTVYRQDLE